jgi:CubicO group peptidase (beta-lactamase class C family)
VEIMTKPRLNGRLIILVLLAVLIAGFPAVSSLTRAQDIRTKKGGNLEPSHRTIDTLSEDDRDKVETIIAKLMQQHGTPGMEVAIQKKGKTIFEAGYVCISQEKNEKKVIPGPDTRFQIDSLTKSFTAFAVLHLVEQGRIDLDKPMGDYMSLPNPNWVGIPVRYYLGMITGIPDDSVTKGSYTKAIARAATKRVARPDPPRGFKSQPRPAGYLIGLDFEPPGSQYEYSDVNYFILGQLVDKKSPSGSFMTYTKNRILTPLGMNDTGFIEFGHGDLWPTPYNNGKKVDPREPESGFSGGGFVSTMSDLEKFGSGLYNRAVLSAKSYEEMWTRTKLTSGGNKGQTINFGLGWDDVSFDAKGDLIRVSKNGGGWGWGSQLTFFPKSEYCVILLQNSQNGNLPKAAVDIEQALTTK